MIIKNFKLGLILTTASLLPQSVHAQATTSQTFTGNGATGFGGALGNGSLTVSSTSSAITFTLNPSGSLGGNDVVIYIDSKSGGSADTSLFTDNGDAGREAVSGYNANNNGSTSRSTVVFASGFAADYAVDFDNSNNYASVYDLSNTSNFQYLSGGGTTSSSPYILTVSDGTLGLVPGSTFNFVATLVSTTAFRSNETIGTPTSATSASNPGFNNPIAFANYKSFTSASDAVPEPADLTLLAMGAGVLGIAARRRFAKS